MPEAPTRLSGAGEALLERNRVSRAFFSDQAPALARACQDMSERLLRGGRLLAFGRGPYLTDAQHVSVEFVHPVIVGKRALPALDLSPAFEQWLPVIARPDDIVMGFGPPEGDPLVTAALRQAAALGAQTFALPGAEGDYAVQPATDDPFIHQEMIEVLYHTLWETVHVFFEHREHGHDVGAAGFLYPFLGGEKQDTSGICEQVSQSIVAKAEDDEALRARFAEEQADRLMAAAAATADRIRRGGRLIAFGNGGSATDANDLALDCATPPKGYRPVPALSLAMEPANLTAVANDIGSEAIFLRQLIAHARPEDVAVAISTSGSSANILAALAEARRLGLLTIALVGYDGGEILRRSLADVALVVPSDYIPRIQEVQASVYHVFRDLLEDRLHD
ncbi:MAG TPA: SIS domain-containing protein [Gemmatimonadales bacterium]|nr:SIS domain-containing protein [Gemmatimonadales bacterium]